jgi:hypothetical protein
MYICVVGRAVKSNCHSSTISLDGTSISRGDVLRVGKMSRSKGSSQLASIDGLGQKTERNHSKSLIFKQPQPVEDMPILLKDANSSVSSTIELFAPFDIGSSLRLSVPPELERKYPVIDRLLEVFSVSSPVQARVPYKSSMDTSLVSPVRAGDGSGAGSGSGDPSDSNNRKDDGLLSPSRSASRAENTAIKEALVREAEDVMSILEAAQVQLLSHV